MSDGYKMTIHTHSPEAAKQLIGGRGLAQILQDTIGNISKNLSASPFIPVDSPFSMLRKSDFDLDDPVVAKFFDNGMMDDVVKIVRLPASESKVKLVECSDKLENIRKSYLRTYTRIAYNALQNASNNSNDAVKMERVASNLENKSTGRWQLEALENIDQCFKFATTSDCENLKVARELALVGEKDYFETSSDLVKSIFENLTPKPNTRVAYTTLGTQDNEPYLLCPKGNFQGKYAVPMEVSKCRENCIDSRVSKDGTVTCNYEAWLKQAFEPQNKVLGRLDVHSPNNEEGIHKLNLEEGERSKKLTEGEFGTEFRLTHSEQGVNKYRNSDKNYEDSIEKQLSDRKASEWGHVQDDKPKMAPRQAQSDGMKTINTQLEPSRKQQKGNEFLEALLNKLNRVEFNTDESLEENLNEDGLQAHRGEMEESYPEATHDGYYDGKERPYAPKDLKGDNEATESVSQSLNKTAKKNDIRGLNDTLNESRQDTKGDETQETSLKDRRKNESDVEKSIEELLSEDENWGHQFTESDLKEFASELGLDSLFEDDRNEYKVGQ